MAACYLAWKTSMIQVVNFNVDNNISFTSQAELSLATGMGKTSLVIREHSSQCL